MTGFLNLKKGRTSLRTAPNCVDLRPVADDEQGSLVDRVYGELLDSILSGRIPPQTILSEVLVSRQMKVSRTPVHDALRQLAKDGFVERTNGRRARVIGLSSDDVYEIFELRKLLESAAAEKAAALMDRRCLVPLRSSFDELTQRVNESDFAELWRTHDEQFHSEIAQACGNGRLLREILQYRLLHRRIVPLREDTQALREAVTEHREILEALEAHDGPRARRSMEVHLSRRQDYFVRVLAKIGGA